jgi:hypothetical protein
MLIFDFCELPLAFAVHVHNGFRGPEALDSREPMELLDACSHDITMKEFDVGDNLENTTSSARQRLNRGKGRGCSARRSHLQRDGKPYRSLGVRPVCFAIRVRMRGPNSESS